MEFYEFQIINWLAKDVEIDDMDDEGEDEEISKDKYVIKIFGVDENGTSISASVLNFTPHFYVKINKPWSSFDIRRFKEGLVNHLGYNGTGLKDVRYLQKKDFWGFTNNENFHFLRLTFFNHKTMKFAARYLSGMVNLPGVYQRKFKVYESNIEPFLRFAHIQNIQPAGWVRIPKSKTQTTSILPSKCELDVEVGWKNVVCLEKEAIAPILIASFDLECMSSDGDFPVPIKNYQKLATNLYNIYRDLKQKSYLDYDIKIELKKSILETFEKGWILTKDALNIPKMTKQLDLYFDHIINIVKGDKGILKKEFIEKVNGSFTTQTNSGDKCLKFLASIEGNKSISITQIRKSIQTWLTKCFESNKKVQVKNIDVESIIEESMKIVFGDKDGIINILTAYMDNFMPELKGDEIIQIGTTFHRYGTQDCHRKVIFNLGSCEKLDGIEVFEFEREEDMLLAWTDLINETNPDIITGYNIFGFDFQYIYRRACELGCVSLFCKLGRLLEHASIYKETKLSSSALGDNLLKYLDMEGRTLIDLMKVVQRDHKLDSYKLDNVANHFMKMNKNDVSPQDIFRLYKGTAEDRSVIADYCVQDCSLCNKLVMKLEIIANNIGMSNVCSVPLSWIFMRGQGVKIFSLVAKECKMNGFLIPVVSKANKLDETDTEETVEAGYEGAIVLPPKTGIYIDKPIAIFDYASLYPSSMISENISHDSIVLDENYDNLPGIKYLDISYDIYEKVGDEKRKIGEEVCRYAQPENDEKGIIPNILMHLLKQRKVTRKKIGLKRITFADGEVVIGFYGKGDDKIVSLDGQILKQVENETDILNIEDKYSPFEKAVLDGLQLAYKITANSLYGQVGASTSPIYMKNLAASTTATGRKMIMLAKDFMEKEYKAEIVYGDSVTSYTPVIIRHNNKVKIEKIESLALKYGNNDWKLCKEDGKEDKEYCELNTIDSWTENGWTKIHRIIRHKLCPYKKIYRINTHKGIVDVTDDHSLISSNGKEVKPNEVKIGDELLHHPFPKLTENSCLYSNQEARIMGFFCGDGSCGKYECPSWELSNSDMNLLQKYKALCEEVYPHLKWKILNTLSSSGVYKLVLNSGSYDDINELVVKYRSILYDGNNKIVPQNILNSNNEVRLSFWNGLYDAEGDDQKSQISIATFNILADSVGYKSSLNENEMKCQDSIKNIYEIPYSGYVYDLTTDNHHFQAGVGTIIVHNTDSLFMSFPNCNTTSSLSREEALKKTYEMAQRAAQHIKPLLKKPHDLEYEKIFYPMILFSKKRYCANKYEHDLEKFKQQSMGIVLKRRDNANIVKKIYGGVIDIILNKHNVRESIQFLKDCLNNLIEGQYPLEDFIITKTLKGHYKDPKQIAHKVLAERIKERSPGNAPQVNDRIPFAYIQVENDKVLQGERIEHPDFIRERNLKLDYLFYITNQIQNPVLQLYALILEQLDGYKLSADHWDKLRANYEKEAKSKKYIDDKIADLREQEVGKLLFNDTINKLKLKKDNQSQITDYFRFG